MKRIFLLAIVVTAGCGSPRQESAKIDSLALARDTVSDYSNTQPETVLGVSVDEFLANSLAPKDMDSDSIFTINAVRVMDQSFVDISGQCVQPGTVVFVARSRHSAEQPEGMDDDGDDIFDIQYSILTAVEKSDGVSADQQLNVNKWNNPPNYTVDVIDEFALSDSCATLAIRYDNQGGSDLPWHRTAVTFYLFTPGGFNQVLEVLEEDTFTMRNFGGGPNHPVNNMSKIELLDTRTNGLKDIRVTTISGLKENPGETTKKVSNFYFDGATYVLR